MVAFPRLLLSPLLVAAALLAGCGTIPPEGSATAPAGSGTGNPSAAPATSGSAEGPATAAASSPGSGNCEYTPTGKAAKPVDLPPTTGVPTSGTVRYVLQFPNGPVTITLDRSKAPCTINSFISLARQGFYDDTKCHRLADSGIFVLQCGDPTGTGTGGPGYQFPDELDGTEKYRAGVVAMANGGPNTNGSQFFLVWDDSTSLPPNYTILGQMDKAGRDVVAAIASQGQDGSYPDGTGKPNAPATIRSVKPA